MILDARSIRTVDLKGNICVHPEADETFPRLKSQQRAVLQQLFGINDPVLQRALTEPANLGYIKNVLGLTEMVIPGEDSRNKQLREIQQLLASAPIVVNVPPPAPSSVGAQRAAPQIQTISSRPERPEKGRAGEGSRQDPMGEPGFLDFGPQGQLPSARNVGGVGNGENATLAGASEEQGVEFSRHPPLATLSCCPPSPSTNCSTTTPWNSRSASAGPTPKPAKPHA
jgi:hypothetical protein